MVQGEHRHFRSCNLCEAMCGLEIRTDERGRITAIRGDKDDPFSRGHICPKAVALQDIHDDPDRLRQPVRRRPDGTFEPIGWEEALDLAANGIRKLQEEHGRDSLALYLGNPNAHNYGSILFGPPLLRAIRTKNRFSATSVDQLPHHFAGYFMFGHMLLLPIPDIDRTDFLLVLGGNPAVSNGSLMTAPDIKKRLQAIRDRGGRIVVVDPRRTETARRADEHFFVRPGTDAFLLAALVHTVLDEGLGDLGHLADFTDGLDAVRHGLAGFTAEQAAPVCGISAEAIRRLARDFAAAPSAVCYGRMGVSTQEFGALCQWLVNVLNIVTGNLDRAGGAMFTKPAFDALAMRHNPGSFDRWRSRVRGLPEFGGELPVAALAEDMAEPGEGQIRGLFTSAGNPVLSTPNGRRLEKALEGLDFMVSIDIYINETTRHADVILPPTSALEHDNYDIIFHVLAIRNTVRFNETLYEPPQGALHDWQIYLELWRRLRRKLPAKERLSRFIMGKAGPHGLVDYGLRNGPFGKKGSGSPVGPLTLKKVKEHPHGIDLGPLEPCLPGRLFTQHKRLDLAPRLLVDDLARLADRRAELAAEDSLVLIGRRQVRSNNSWMHNYPRLMRGADRCTLLVHPDDARYLGLESEGHAEVTSRVGRIVAPVEISDEIMPGVVSLPHGWGHGRRGVRLQVANAHPGVSINDLTDEAMVDTLSGNAALSGVPVRVAPASANDSTRTEEAAGG
ncbi:MAG: molybdopterin oxidoreductase family protein [Acidobacteriota bacterium]